mmetsp:Transcript_1540/g.2282  ORF Transcript_1540/g.2282 Transcript_1540/m.2282 type:complete len:141 (+) Transcript_1540:44-466(+)
MFNFYLGSGTTTGEADGIELVLGSNDGMELVLGSGVGAGLGSGVGAGLGFNVITLFLLFEDLRVSPLLLDLSDPLLPFADDADLIGAGAGLGAGLGLFPLLPFLLPFPTPLYFLRLFALSDLCLNLLMPVAYSVPMFWFA